MLYALTPKDGQGGELKRNHGAAAGIRTRVPGCFLVGMGSRCHRPGCPPYLNQELRCWLWTTAANQAHQPIVCKHFRRARMCGFSNAYCSIDYCRDSSNFLVLTVGNGLDDSHTEPSPRRI